MGNALYTEVNDFNTLLMVEKRRSSVDRSVPDLIGMEDYSRKGLMQSPSMSRLIVQGQHAHKTEFQQQRHPNRTVSSQSEQTTFSAIYSHFSAPKSDSNAEHFSAEITLR